MEVSRVLVLWRGSGEGKMRIEDDGEEGRRRETYGSYLFQQDLALLFEVASFCGGRGCG